MALMIWKTMGWFLWARGRNVARRLGRKRTYALPLDWNLTRSNRLDSGPGS